MPNKSEATVCPNPKCNRKIEEPILLNNLSTKPVEQYFACPHCFIKLETETMKSEDIMSEDLMSEEPESIVAPPPPSLEESLEAAPATPIEEREEGPVEPSETKEKGSEKCLHHFGYLTKRPKDSPIPQECLTCPKIVDCMLKLTGSR